MTAACPLRLLQSLWAECLRQHHHVVDDPGALHPGALPGETGARAGGEERPPPDGRQQGSAGPSAGSPGPPSPAPLPAV